jgi:hypothetical protein
MGNKSVKIVLGVAMLSVLPTMYAIGADLILKVDNSKQQVAVTNTLSTPVSVHNLVGHDGMNLPLFANLGAGATANVALRFDMPVSVAIAIGEVEGLRRYLTVDIK